MSPSAESTPVVILGLDGATFEVVQPLREMGALPNLDSMMKEGMVCNLESTMPPVTGPAWFALATGKSPGKTGVFDFRNRDRDDLLSFKSLSSAAIRGQAIWDLLSDADHRVCVFNYPMLYPAYPVNGIMVSGLLSPLDGNITYPKEFRRELERMTGKYAIGVPFCDLYYADREPELVAEVAQLLHKHTTIIERLLSQEPWDLFIGVLTATDIIQHYLWKHWDPNHSCYDPARSPEFRKLFMAIWHQVDEAVGRIRHRLSNDTYFFVVSDHGFGALQETFYVNEWLHQKGLLSWKSSGIGLLNALARSVADRAPGLVRALPQRVRRSRAVGFARANVEDLLDLDRTLAFMPAVSDICGQIYVNRALCGPFRSGEYNRVVDGIAHALCQLPEELGIKLDVKVHSATDLYHGPDVELAPDLVLVINHFRCRVTGQRGRSIFAAGSGSPNRTGTHRSKGILIAVGPGLPSGCIGDAQITDVAPTVLQLAGLPIPPSVDGKALFNASSAHDLAQHPWHEAGTGQAGGSDVSRSGLSDEDEASVIERLRSLGYV